MSCPWLAPQNAWIIGDAPDSVIVDGAASGAQKDKTCSIITTSKSNGADARSPSKPARSPARLTAPCSPPTARPSCYATVVSAKEPKPGLDFFPLTVNYQEKTYAAGKIPGGYFKREGRPTEKETLVSRLIDRPIRPLFAEGYKNDTQVVCTVCSMTSKTIRTSLRWSPPPPR